ncbi:MAG: TonB-dependent receptor plug domain-containing protein [Bacteroidota bacterium]
MGSASKFLCLLFILVGSYSLQVEAQTIKVIDSETEMPLENVTVYSRQSEAVAITNNKGMADVHSFKSETEIEIRLLGYESVKLSFEQLERQNMLVRLVISGIGLDELVISATKWNKSVSSTTQQIISISPGQVQLSQTQTAADLLTLTGAVFLQKSQQAGGRPMIRGFAANRLLYSVDGVRMNTAIFRSGNLQNVISIDPFSIEKTEVLFGPGSVLYGSDAIGGVMMFRTLRPYFSLNDSLAVNAKASFRYASANNERTGHVHLSLGSRKVATLFGYTRFDYGDLRMGSSGPDEYLNDFYVVRENDSDLVVSNRDPQIQKNTGYVQDNFTWRLKWIPNDKTTADAGVYYSATGDYNRYDRLIRTNNGKPTSAEWYYGPQKWLMTRLSLQHTSTTKAFDEMSIQGAWQRFEESRNDRSFGKQTLRIRKELVDAYSLNADFRKKTSDKFEIHYGVESIVNQVSSTGSDQDISTGMTVPGPSRYPNAIWSSYAGYLTAELMAGARSIISMGIRYNSFAIQADFDTTFYKFPFTSAELSSGALTGSAGWKYDLNENWQLDVIGSSGFRSPNVDDMGKVFDSEPGSVVVPNTNLKSEYAWNAEVGISGTMLEKIHLDLSGYHTWLDNAMVRRDFQLNGADSVIYDGVLSQVQAVQNAAVAKVMGVHLGFWYAFHTHWSLQGSFNYQKGEEELDDGSSAPLRHAAPFFGSLRVTYRKSQFTAEASVESVGAVSYSQMPSEYIASPHLFASDTNGNPYAPSWTIFNFRMKQGFKKHYTLVLGVDNIADLRYRTFGSGMAAAGRNISFGIHASF